jgi:DNA-binding MurR/RpiR family transcriptional regulator
MNLFELMDAKESSFSKTDKIIYEAIKKFPDQFAHDSLSTLCNNGAYTKSAMTRFAHKLGFGGFTEFQFQFQQDINSYKTSTEKAGNAEIYGKILARVSESVSRDTVKDLIRHAKNANRVFIIGTNLSRLPAEELLITMSFSENINAIVPQPDVLPYRFRDDDMIIIYSAISGSSHQELMRSLRREKQGNPYMVLITTNAKHPLRHNFNEMIALPTSNMKDSMSHTILSDTFAFLMFNDIVAECLDE